MVGVKGDFPSPLKSPGVGTTDSDVPAFEFSNAGCLWEFLVTAPPPNGGNEDVSLLFTVRSTTSLKRRSLFFTSSPNSREDLLVKTLHFISLVKRSAYAAREEAA